MVLTKRGIKPTQDYVQQNQIQGTKNIVLLSSEQYTNVGIIEQLTSFFEYSSSIFSELLTDIEKSSRRIQELGQRVHNASLTMPSIEQKFELSNNGDNFITTSRVDFQAELGEQSYLFPQETNIPALSKVYEGCFLPPPLQQLDPYREDNMSCAKLYSNPNFFIESWISAQKEKIAKDKLKREERRQKRAERRKEKQINTQTEKVNAKSVNLRRDRFKNMEDSPSTTSDNSTPFPTQNNVNTFTPLQPPPQNTNTSSFGPPPSTFGNTPPPPNFGNTPPPPSFGNTPPPPNFGNTPPPPPNFGNTPPPPPNFGNTPPPPNFSNTPPPPNFGNTPPPPPNFGNTPPPPSFNNSNTPPPPPQQNFNNVPQFDNSPTPPPPPQQGGLGGELLQIESSSSSGGGLLDAIKKGVNLKKSEKPVEKEIIPESNSGFNTNLIAMVLNQRREALEDSDDDDDSDASWD